eukprot:CAMPEP_0196661952 /NCGR_PEP_ID=MMETSP1086-20130531/46552_1 /TAXON_ID=77921 /ORGANISM="Cyanoptyche  gloeocystis , Strain SAG4.97" /LENGTH=50 /DNA_ID=CAMNT_0041997099 /DNA_START=378 /DNA_END=527 /DNA_ORIENTATION=+
MTSFKRSTVERGEGEQQDCSRTEQLRRWAWMDGFRAVEEASCWRGTWALA